jgi:hypothetical protein
MRLLARPTRRTRSHPLRVVPVRLAGCEGVVPTAASRLACTEAIAMELFVIWAVRAGTRGGR